MSDKKSIRSLDTHPTGGQGPGALAFWFFAGGICMFLSIDHVAKGPLLEISLGLIWLGVAAGSLGLLGSSPAGL